MQATTRALISVEEYLTTMYHPDCDYVDGEVLERNTGEGNHAWLQAALGSYFFVRRKQWNITVLTEMRVQVKPTRFRIPYIWVLDSETKQAYIATPAEGLREVKDGILRTENPAFEFPLSELFS